ncbi:MAG TPA: GNAT family N-acetyltransferase [Chthoniobacteraceae bacterium]|jgi:GNAT superfamily N-acetyltransferase
MEDLTFRFFHANDLEAVVALECAQLCEHDLPSSPDGIRQILRGLAADERDGFIVLAVGGNEIVGFAYVAALASLEYGGRIGWLEELYVSAAWRNGGIGRRLLDAAISRARELNWKAVELEVVAGHERAARLYERVGFRKIDRARYALEIAERRSL